MRSERSATNIPPVREQDECAKALCLQLSVWVPEAEGAHGRAWAATWDAGTQTQRWTWGEAHQGRKMKD